MTVNFLLKCVKKRRPQLFGICFRHQLIANAFGGTVGNNPTKKLFFGSELVTVDDKLRKTLLFQSFW